MIPLFHHHFFLVISLRSESEMTVSCIITGDKGGDSHGICNTHVSEVINTQWGGETNITIQKVKYRSEPLLPIDADSRTSSPAVVVYGEHHGWDVKVTKKGVDEFNLLGS